MLLELNVSNFALIENLKISFSPGLNVLSGETGVGKSIIIGAINLLLGERAAVEQIRQGSEQTLIEGVVKIEPQLEAKGPESTATKSFCWPGNFRVTGAA